jgi:hypothetical protein
MDNTWFTNKGQIMQLIVQSAALCLSIGGRMTAWPSPTTMVILAAIIISVVLIVQEHRATREGRRKATAKPAIVQPIASPSQPSAPQRTDLAATAFRHLRNAFDNLTVPQQYTLKLLLESAPSAPYISRDSLEHILTARGFGATVDAGIIGALCGTEFVAVSPDGMGVRLNPSRSRDIEEIVLGWKI